MFRLFILLNQRNAASSQGPLGCRFFFFLTISQEYWRHFPDIANVFQILSTLAGYGGLAVGFEPISNGEIFWLNNNILLIGSYLPANFS